jgi:hypothetical protein
MTISAPPPEPPSLFRPTRVQGARPAERGGRLLVLDSGRWHLHELFPPLPAIWRRCDGRRTVADIAAEFPAMSIDDVLLALEELTTAQLLTSPA